MPVITFQPSGRQITVAVGTSLLDASTQAGVSIEAPCGGEGSCGDCRVRLLTGKVEQVTRECLAPEDAVQGWVLACSSRVIDDAVLDVPASNPEETGPVVVDAFDHPYRSFPAERPSPPVIKRLVSVDPPSLDNSFGDFERLSRALGIKIPAPATLTALRSLADSLRTEDHEVTVTLAGVSSDSGMGILRVEPGDTRRRLHGLAVDIGTTTCAVHLVDLISGRILGTASGYNGQIARGADIISRINYASTPQRLEELRSLVLTNINNLILDLCRDHSVTHTQIDCTVVAGNTTMVHLFLGLKPEYIRLEPYTPTINHLPPLQGGEVGLEMNPDGLLLVAPGVGSYVGGDITAGLLQTSLADEESDEVCLFLDIGTNGEVVVGNGEWLMACAASAGPAFEGSGVGCGMRASRGAIERIRIDQETGKASYSVIGGGKPKGICGSAMIDLLAELQSAELLDPSGKLLPESRNDLIRPCKDSSRFFQYTIETPEATDSGNEIFLDDRDILNLMRTKAAVYSACSLMLRSVGLDFDSVVRVYVAGGFGRFLDLEKSIQVGLLPDLPLEKFIYLGNSSLAGAKAILLNGKAHQKVEDLANRITYLELNADPAYMDEYMAALFLPHTDLSRFPSVKSPMR